MKFTMMDQPSSFYPIHRNILAMAVIVAAIAGGATALTAQPILILGLLASICVVFIVALRPHFGPYLWLFLCPLVVGIARGKGLMVVRPNEVILLLIASGVAVHILWNYCHRIPINLPLQNTDWSIFTLVLFGSFLPLLISYGRGIDLVQDDLLYAMVFVKYSVLYAVFRFSLHSDEQVGTCLKVALLSGSIVAIIAALQVLDLFGIPQLLSIYYDSPFEGSSGANTLRGSSTVASSFGLADMMAMCLAITIAMATLTNSVNKIPLIGAGLLFLGGCIAAGSFSGFIGGAIVILSVGILTGQLISQLSILLPTIALGVALFWSTISARLSGFSGYLSLPKSWIGRLDNLERFFWPELAKDWNWLFGVRPAARIEAPEAWRDWVYIESGHTWLLWTGGLPLLFAFLGMVFIVVHDYYGIATKDRAYRGVAAVAAIAATAMVFVLMLFDPHLTVRGGADLYFPLLALPLIGYATKIIKPRPLFKTKSTSVNSAAG
jgi:hypothetical protein